MVLSAAAAVSIGTAAPARLPELSVKGKAMVTPAGKPVELRGVNLGNWLMLEMWMLDLAGRPGVPDSQLPMEELLTRRFGAQKKEALMNLYRENWIKERDFKIIESFRFNLVRLPLNYRMFEDDAKPKKLKPNCFAWVDRAVDMAEKHGMYVILDMHGVQGGQSVYDHTGFSGQNKLWASQSNKERMAWLWGEVAKKYRSRSAVVAYDVFNEPYGGTHEGQNEVFRMSYETIRRNDPKKLIFAHGHYDGFAHYGSPKQNGWKNVGYQLHFYPGLFGNGMPTIRTHAKHLASLAETAKLVDEYNAPFLVGEMNVVFGRAGGAEMMRRTYDLHAKYGWMTTMWSYKALSLNGGIGEDHWGMATNAEPYKPINLETATYAQIAAWFRNLGTMKLEVNRPLKAMMVPKTVSLPALPDIVAGRTTAPQEELSGWTQADIGGALKGGLKNLGGGKIELYGGGSDIWGVTDQCRFLYKEVEGDFVMTARLDSMEELEQYSKAGLMVRASLEPNAPSVIMTTFFGGDVQVAFRRNAGENFDALPVSNQKIPLWFRLIRKGDKFTATASQDGKSWTQVGEGEAAGIGPKALVGALALSHDAPSLIKLGYSGLSIERP